MARVKFEHVADGRNHELVFVGELQAVHAVDKLRAIRHSHFFRISVEDIERHSAEHRGSRWTGGGAR
jgi:hypothetical protein